MFGWVDDLCFASLFCGFVFLYTLGFGNMSFLLLWFWRLALVFSAHVLPPCNFIDVALSRRRNLVCFIFSSRYFLGLGPWPLTNNGYAHLSNSPLVIVRFLKTVCYDLVYYFNGV